MRRIELLINDIRFNTNNLDTNRYTDFRLVKLFNDAQDTIQALIFMADMGAKHFVKEIFKDLTYGVEEYALPSDIYSINSVNSVARAVNEGSEQYYTPLRQLTEKERRKGFGYILQGSNLIISPYPRTNLTSGIRINYTKKLPKLSPRVGQVQSSISGTSITLAAGFTTEDITTFEDYVTIVDRYGTVKESGILLDSYAGGVIGTSSTFTSVAAGDYVVLGEVATSHSELPQNAEALLTAFVERKIQAIDSSSDVSNADLFTEEEKDLIAELYKKNENDVKYPAIVDDTYINE